MKKNSIEKIIIIEIVILLQHMLSLPMFAIMPKSVRRGFVGLGRPKGSSGSSSYSSIRPYTMLALNLFTQLICVAGVNQLSSVCTSTFFYFYFFFLCCASRLPRSSLFQVKAPDPAPPFVPPISPFVGLFIHSLLFYLFQ